MKIFSNVQLSNEIKKIEIFLYQSFSKKAFVAAAVINNYSIYPQEYKLIAHSVQSRQNEFSTARWLARIGLKKFGKKNWPVLTGRLGNPLWPQELIGSISHDGNLCVVVLMYKKKLLNFGIDLIYLPKHNDKFIELAPIFMAHSNELTFMKMLITDINHAALLFSIKESIVKAISHKINDFIDLRSIILQFINNKLRFKIADYSPNVDITANVIGDYIISVVKVYT